MEKDITEQAAEFYKSHTKEDCYDFAIEILYRLQGAGFCIWQTYTRDDIEANEGKRPTDEHMQELCDALQCFENIRV